MEGFFFFFPTSGQSFLHLPHPPSGCLGSLPGMPIFLYFIHKTFFSLGVVDLLFTPIYIQIVTLGRFYIAFPLVFKTIFSLNFTCRSNSGYKMLVRWHIGSPLCRCPVMDVYSSEILHPRLFYLNRNQELLELCFRATTCPSNRTELHSNSRSR